MFLSIIVPVFNVEKYVKKCVYSIIQAKLTDYEVILVLGNSKDDSSELCHQMKEQFNNIVIINQTGKGLSNARNCGMEIANGKYVTFIDSDDYIIPGKFNEFIKKVRKLDENKANIDLIITDFIMVNEKNELVYIQKQIIETQDITLDKEYTGSFIKKKGAIWNAWRYLYSNNFLKKNKRIFLENYLCEDVDFAIRSILQAEYLYYYHNPYYCYCGNRSDSLFNKGNVIYSMSLLKIVNDLINEIEKVNYPYNNVLNTKLLREVILSIPTIYDMNIDDQKKVILRYKDNLKLLSNTHYKIGKVVYYIVKLFGIKSIAGPLYLLKKIRRKFIYG